jgi:hypothetical protein
MAHKPCSNERRRLAPSPSARDLGLFTAPTAGGPPDLERPEEWERQGFGGSLGLFLSKCTRLLPVREANGRADFHCALSGLLRLPGIAGGFRDRTLGRAGRNRRDYSSGPSRLALLPALT